MRSIAATTAIVGALLAFSFAPTASAVEPVPQIEVASKSQVLCSAVGVEPGTFKPFRYGALIGKRLIRARAMAARHGCVLRVVEVNGTPRPGTDDHRVDRINIGIERFKKRGWKVVSVISVG